VWMHPVRPYFHSIDTQAHKNSVILTWHFVIQGNTFFSPSLQLASLSASGARQ
jgi:hypothetical protein